MYDFANILLAGPCNLSCIDCIGRKLTSWKKYNTLRDKKLPGLERFITTVRTEGIKTISITGINTDPLLYKYLNNLIVILKTKLPGTTVSLHTNGLLMVKKRVVSNMYDRLTISIPSLKEATYKKMTGRSFMPDFRIIIRSIEKPLKISILVTETNRPEIPGMIDWFQNLGIRRLVLRHRCGETRDWCFFPKQCPDSYFGCNPVYLYRGMEITQWRFSNTELHCVNLYPDGSLNEHYLLEERRDENIQRNQFTPAVSEKRNLCVSRHF